MRVAVGAACSPWRMPAIIFFNPGRAGERMSLFLQPMMPTCDPGFSPASRFIVELSKSNKAGEDSLRPCRPLPLHHDPLPHAVLYTDGAPR